MPGPAALARAFGDLLRTVVVYLPGVPGRRLRYLYYRRRLRSCGRSVRIDEGVFIDAPEFVTIGDNVWIDRNVILIAGPFARSGDTVTRVENSAFSHGPGELVIGDNVHIAPMCLIQAHGGVSIGSNLAVSAGTKIYSASNLPARPSDPERHVDFTSMNESGAYLVGPVVLEDNVGVGLNATILPGVAIGRDSFVGVGALVTSSFGPNSYVIGQPARRIRSRFRTGGA